MWSYLRIGDEVVRMLAGLRMPLRVTGLENGRIQCGGGWEFDPVTGAEIDDVLGWGPSPLGTGSYLEPRG